MATIENVIAQAGDKLGGEFQPLLTGPQIAQMLADGRIRVGRQNNALMIEFDGECYTLPDAWNLLPFRP